ncbi:LAFA_0G13080g1_1 [Lachancea sp. 'fantastica']|nr:LAFA_0G13080g1_1 [Lachancea sp. 'fantastica']
MLNDQLYVLCCFLAAKSDVLRVSRLILEQNQLNWVEILKIVCVLWPELDDPLRLRRIFDSVEALEKTDSESQSESHLGTLESVIDGNQELIAAVEASPKTLLQRKVALQQYVDSELKKKTGISIESHNWKSAFFQARVLVCNAVVEDPLFYKPLWSQLSAAHNPEYMGWISGIVKPLSHYSNRTGIRYPIAEFQSFSTSKTLDLLWHSVENVEEPTFRGALTYELLPYLKYVAGYNEFLETIFNEENFPLDAISNFKRYKMLALELLNQIPSEFQELFQKRAITILFDNGSALQKIDGLDLRAEQSLILSSVIDNIKILDYLDVKTLQVFAQKMDVLQLYGLKDIYKLSQSSLLIQKSCFSTMCIQQLESTESYETLETLGSFMQGDPIFQKLDVVTKKLIVVESLLGKGHFDMLQKFAQNSEFDLEDNVLLKFFWSFFNSATSGRANGPNMLNARRILELLPKGQHRDLLALLNVAEKLSNYSLTVSKGVPLRPSALIEYKHRPYEIISKLLELNRGLYKRLEETFEIVKLLYSALQLERSTNFDDEYTKTCAIHIDFALANSDFEFAYHEATNLLQRPKCEEFWSTVLQVGKFFDPAWPDSEIPTEIIYLQLEILGKLLHVCPVEEVEAVISQWSGLESELSTRDLINDSYSLSHTNSGDFKTKIVEEVSASASNFLSTGFKWAIDRNA